MHKLNIELEERGLKKGNMIQHGVYHKNMGIFYRGKIVSTSYVQDCSLVQVYLRRMTNCYGQLRHWTDGTQYGVSVKFSVKATKKTEVPC